MTRQEAIDELDRLGLTVGEAWEYVGGGRADALYWTATMKGIPMKLYFETLQKKASDHEG